ncbi:MAG: phytoene/squalene synthase family protein [Wenzhouxiangella sp.]
MDNPTLTPAELARETEAVIAQGSKSFAAATRLFPPDLRRDVRFLYAWCRHCDDLTDGQDLGHGRIATASSEVVARMHAHSMAALDGAPPPELPYLALAELARNHPLQRSLVAAHIRGFELDVAGWQPASLDDTLQYCYHTAGTVGVMMAGIMGVRDTVTLHRASDLGIAFQLTNIARDVAEDALGGRSYLPQDWRSDADLEIADLADPTQRERVFPLVERLILEAEPYYASAAIGVRALPRRAAWAIASARDIYRDIGQQILKRGPQRLGERSYTRKGRKLWRFVTAAPAAIAARQTRSQASRAALWTPSELA